MYQTVVFDLDGTLLNTLQDLAAACNHTLSALHLPCHPADAYRQMLGNGTRNLIQCMLPPEQRGEATYSVALALFESYYTKHMNDFTAPYPGIVSMLTLLKKHRIHIGVVSNKADVFVQPIIQQFFPGLIDTAVGLRAGENPKPDPSSVLWLLQNLEAISATTLYCGDSDVDIYTAQNAGLTSCGVLWGFRGKAELNAAGADFLVTDTKALQALILE